MSSVVIIAGVFEAFRQTQKKGGVGRNVGIYFHLSPNKRRREHQYGGSTYTSSHPCYAWQQRQPTSPTR
jgi:hypothetical protein